MMPFETKRFDGISRALNVDRLADFFKSDDDAGHVVAGAVVERFFHEMIDPDLRVGE